MYVSFRLVGDSTYRSEQKKLTAHISELFGDRWQLDHEDPEGAHDREVVYRLPTLPDGSEESREAYFRNLKELFLHNQRYLPSFTQGSETMG